MASKQDQTQLSSHHKISPLCQSLLRSSLAPSPPYESWKKAPSLSHNAVCLQTSLALTVKSLVHGRTRLSRYEIFSQTNLSSAMTKHLGATSLLLLHYERALSHSKIFLPSVRNSIAEQNSSFVVCWALCPAWCSIVGSTLLWGEVFQQGDFSLGVNMGSDSIPPKLFRKRV